MSGPDRKREALPNGAPEFASTRWSLVLAAGRHESPEAKRALTTLCEVYWYPLCAYVRRQVVSVPASAAESSLVLSRPYWSLNKKLRDQEAGAILDVLLAVSSDFTDAHTHRPCLADPGACESIEEAVRTDYGGGGGNRSRCGKG